MAAVVVAMDFALTFVTPGTGVYHPFGVARVRHWLRDDRPDLASLRALRLCPPLALTSLNYIFPVGGGRSALHSHVRHPLDLAARQKARLPPFYLRERGSYSDDGAAYITADGRVGRWPAPAVDRP